MAHRVGKCIFCGDVGQLTGEHVFSHWTHKFLPPRSKKYVSLRATSYIDQTEFKNVSKHGDVRDIKVYCVCEKRCNNGWMRQYIEDTAIQIMKSLIIGSDSRIFPHQRKLIASWAVMKAMVSEYDFGQHVSTHHTHRKYIMKHHHPPLKGWGVWIGHYIRRAPTPSWLHLPFRVAPKNYDESLLPRRVTSYNSAAFTQIIGELFIQTIHTPFPDFAIRFRFPSVHRGNIVRIWPPTNISIKWPLKTMSDDDVHCASWAIKDFMEKSGTQGPPIQRREPLH